jgi:hypothetical protein
MPLAGAGVGPRRPGGNRLSYGLQTQRRVPAQESTHHSNPHSLCVIILVLVAVVVLDAPSAALPIEVNALVVLERGSLRLGGRACRGSWKSLRCWWCVEHDAGVVMNVQADDHQQVARKESKDGYNEISKLGSHELRWPTLASACVVYIALLQYSTLPMHSETSTTWHLYYRSLGHWHVITYGKIPLGIYAVERKVRWRIGPHRQSWRRKLEGSPTSLSDMHPHSHDIPLRNCIRFADGEASTQR